MHKQLPVAEYLQVMQDVKAQLSGRAARSARSRRNYGALVRLIGVMLGCTDDEAAERLAAPPFNVRPWDDLSWADFMELIEVGIPACVNAA